MGGHGSRAICLARWRFVVGNGVRAVGLYCYGIPRARERQRERVACVRAVAEANDDVQLLEWPGVIQ